MDQSWLMIIFGVAFLGIGLILLFRRSNLKKQCTAKTSGTVIGYDNRYDTDPRGRSRVTYAPIFSYEADGMIYEHTSQVFSSYHKFKDGRRVTVFYAPYNTALCYVKEDGGATWMSVAFTAVGGALTVLGLFNAFLCIF